MKTITLTCPTCDTSFEKPLKEVTRQRKNKPDRRFFCSLRCSGLDATNRIRMSRLGSESSWPPQASEAAAKINTKYSVEEKPFVELLRRAKSKRHEVSIDVPFLMDLFKKQEGKCALTGVPLDFHRGGIMNPSIDRKENAKGYVKENVQLVLRGG